MNKSQRIYLNTGNTATDKYIKLNLEQDVDTLEVLSMSISTSDAYQDFNADYGVLVGRVIANDGIGVPNAKISIFIPLTDDDELNANIKSVYPYKTPRDQNKDGKRYNLLPRVGIKNPYSGMIKPAQAFGSFPIKEELVTNQDFLDVYKKYYKYTALTNSDGDYMIFGAPIGTQIIHMSVDITDINQYSMTPISMVNNLGYSPNLFINDITIKPQNDLNDLPNIDTQEITVDIIPFWGDVDNFEIGITRQDFRIRAKLSSTFVIFGNIFTDGSNAMWGDKDPAYQNDIVIQSLYLMTGGDQSAKMNNTGTAAKRGGKITEKIYYYPPEITDEMIDNNDPKANPANMKVLRSDEYSSYKKGGDFIFIVNCNRRRVVSDEFGGETEIDYSSNVGIFTRFRGFMTVEIAPEDIGLGLITHIGHGSYQGEVDEFRYKLKIPQGSPIDPILGQTFDISNTNVNTINWTKQHTTFSASTIYSIAKYNGIVSNIDSGQDSSPNSNFFLHRDYVDSTGALSCERTVGIIYTNNNDIVNNGQYDPPNNGLKVFGAEWLNFSIYLPQVGQMVEDNNVIGGMRSTTNFTKYYKSPYYFNDNNQPIAAGVKNTKWFARSDIHMTDFIIIPKEDLTYFNNTISSNNKNGLKIANGSTLVGKYRKTSTSNDFYFSAGVNGSNCIKYLFDLGLI